MEMSSEGDSVLALGAVFAVECWLLRCPFPFSWGADGRLYDTSVCAFYEGELVCSAHSSSSTVVLTDAIHIHSQPCFCRGLGKTEAL